MNAQARAPTPTRVTAAARKTRVHGALARLRLRLRLRLRHQAGTGRAPRGAQLFAAALGCRVVAWEPVPVFRAFIEAAATLNNLSHRIHLRAAVVGAKGGQRVRMTVPQQGIWGTASVAGLNVDPSIRSPTYEVEVPTETLDEVVTEQACIMKLDVEGYEPQVIDGARSFFRKFPPKAILTEYTPGVQERKRDWAAMRTFPRSLQILKEAGYRVWNLEGTSKNRLYGPKSSWRRSVLPPLREVTDSSLRAEFVNCDNMVGGAFLIPWDLHPRSLHAEFAHNTDLLVTLEPGAVAKSTDVGVWPDSPYGLGGGYCRDVLRDGNAMEMVGRLCVEQNRSAMIEAAIRHAELKRPLPFKQSTGFLVRSEARNWRLEGPMRSRNRKMVRLSPGEEPRTRPGSRRGRGRGGKLQHVVPARRGKAKGRGRGSKK